MGRKITMTGKNAQYIEHRGANTTPDNDREILMKGDEAVYQEIANGSKPTEKQEPPMVVQGDYVVNKHVENEVNSVASGATGVNVNKKEE